MKSGGAYPGGALIVYLMSGFFATVLYYLYFWANHALMSSLHAVERPCRWTAVAYCGQRYAAVFAPRADQKT